MFSLLTMVRNVGEAHLVAAILIWSLIERRQVLVWVLGLSGIVLTPCVRWREKYKQSLSVITGQTGRPV